MNTTITFPCSRCGQPAVTFTLHPAGVGEGMWRDRDRLERTGFLGTMIHFGELLVLVVLMRTVEERDYEAIRNQAGPDLIGFHCWECGADYCQACWRIGPPEFAADFPGFYDRTEGVCPAGHSQVVDD